MEMFERHRSGRPASEKAAGERIDPADAEVSVVERPLSETELCCLQLRGRWELASVLNFMHVFQPVIQSKLKISAEEMEMVLVTPDEILAQLHIALLMGIPPVSKNLVGSNAWVTVLCKKLKLWWPWVAEGEVPLVADHGEEILGYKELNPITRLLMLKALCEIRVQQDDILRFIDEEVKRGLISKFRKDSIGGDGNGTTYWYDGDSVIGHRLYRNVAKVEFKHKPRGRGRLTQPVVNFQWETLATNCKEFREISDKFSRSKISLESAVGYIIKDEIMAAVEALEKKKERELKRRQREAILLDGFRNCKFARSRRACRDRKPVSYTFDEYDRSINEALQEAKMMKRAGLKKDDDKLGEHIAAGEVAASAETLPNDPADNEIQMSVDQLDDDEKYWGMDDSDEDEDYVGKVDDECRGNYSDGDTQNTSDGSVEERDGFPRQTRLRSRENQKDYSAKGVVGFQRRVRTRSSGTVAHNMVQMEMKKRLRERPTRNTNYGVEMISDSEGGSTSEDDQENQVVLCTQKGCSVAANESSGQLKVRKVVATVGES